MNCDIENLQKLKDRLALTQADMAKRLGLNRQATISDYLRGVRKIPETLARLVDLELQMLEKRTTPIFKHDGRRWKAIDQGDKRHVTLKAIERRDTSAWLYHINQLRQMPYFPDLRRWLVLGKPFPEDREY